ncbi:Tautomerase/MIF superfamily [Pterulicium gracile]|uniref:L-dopachrome isomerase n=1 Tax=Pterulicium gracile TaxID=1884261 RepID=A0A5C3Q944_9AGAR|nr:Tautomerase/MIF superfamily [Pterula gracilis]
MPFLDLLTNVKLENPQLKSFLLDFSKAGAEILDKPESYISVCYTFNDTLTFNGNFDPAFQLRVTSLNNVNAESNEKYTVAFTKFLKDKLGLADDRGYIAFNDPGMAFVGHKNTTFATIFAKK